MKGRCAGCGNETEISSSFKSIRHEHHNSRGVQGKFFILAEVKDVVTGNSVSVCESCKLKICAGMVAGGNIE